MNCEACGEPLVAGARICGACGRPAATLPGTILFCVSCGAGIAEGARFCPNCGRSVVAGPVGEGTPAGPATGPPRAPYAAPGQAPYQAPQPAVSAGIPVQYAGFWARFAARLLDVLISIAISLVPAIILGVIAFQAVYPDDQMFITQQQEDDAFAAGFWTGWAVWVVVAVIYVVIGWAQGGTWGMRALGLRMVRRSTSDKPGFGPAVVRYLVSIVSSWPLYLGFLWMLWDDAKQTWHDKAANTVVVYQR
ncbi:MAG: RDD family protein [Chloroflexota bacterium]|nr:RDD family protein [Chloroflexota bacterium]